MATKAFKERTHRLADLSGQRGGSMNARRAKRVSIRLIKAFRADRLTRAMSLEAATLLQFRRQHRQQELTILLPRTSARPIAADNVEMPSDIAPEELRAQRIAAMTKVFGIWKDREDAPKDGLEYQKDVRSEW